MKNRLKILATVLLFLSFGLTTSHAGDKGHTIGTVDDLDWGPIGSLPAGAEMAVITGHPSKEGVFTLRLRMPDGYEIPPHWHPAIENITVIEGTFNVGMGEEFDRDSTTALSAGAYAVMPPESRHYAWTSGTTTVQLHGMGPWQINYVNPEDDPR